MKQKYTQTWDKNMETDMDMDTDTDTNTDTDMDMDMDMDTDTDMDMDTDMETDMETDTDMDVITSSLSQANFVISFQSISSLCPIKTALRPQLNTVVALYGAALYCTVALC
jgi:hypothetical protein